MTSQSNDQLLTYVGTYTHGDSEGIYVYRTDPDSGEMTRLSTTGGIENPSFLIIGPDKRHLFAVSEVNEFEGKASGAVAAFEIDDETGALTHLNKQPTHGTGPCHMTIDSGNRFVFVANYQSGSITMLPVQSDGSLDASSDFVQHEGSSVNPDRQVGPHAHSVTLSPDERYLIVADLGIDKVLVYEIDYAAGKLNLKEDSSTSVAPGAGPRHFEFHPNGQWAYLINEIGSTVTVFDFDASNGSLKERQTISTLPSEFSGTSHCADIHVHPSGRYLYGSNRGHDSLAIYGIDESNGHLHLIGHESTQGSTPRNFAIHPNGTLLLAANQRSDSIVAYQLDSTTGMLKPAGQTEGVPAPVCIKFLAL